MSVQSPSPSNSPYQANQPNIPDPKPGIVLKIVKNIYTIISNVFHSIFGKRRPEEQERSSIDSLNSMRAKRFDYLDEELLDRLTGNESEETLFYLQELRSQRETAPFDPVIFTYPGSPQSGKLRQSLDMSGLGTILENYDETECLPGSEQIQKVLRYYVTAGNTDSLKSDSRFTRFIQALDQQHFIEMDHEKVGIVTYIDRCLEQYPETPIAALEEIERHFYGQYSAGPAKAEEKQVPVSEKQEPANDPWASPNPDSKIPRNIQHILKNAQEIPGLYDFKSVKDVFTFYCAQCENRTISDPEMNELKVYLKGSDEFFKVYFEEYAVPKAPDLYNELMKTPGFSQNPPRILDSGAVSCTAAQFESAILAIKACKPVLTPCFNVMDIPELGIFQSARVNLFIREVLLGPKEAYANPLNGENAVVIVSESRVDPVEDLVAETKNEEPIPDFDKNESPEVEETPVAAHFTNFLSSTYDAIKKAATAIGSGVVSVATYPFRESSDPKDIEWKIERFEALIRNTQANLGKVFPPVESDRYLGETIAHENQEMEDEGINLIGVLKNFQSVPLSEKSDRLTPEYLKVLRNHYNSSFLDNYRKAADWAEKAGKLSYISTEMKGMIDQIDQIGFYFYAENDFNEASKSVVDTLLQNAPDANGRTPSTISGTIDSTYKRIHSIGSNLRGSTLNQLANSLRGHLNGIYGLAIFDPNMQSNFPEFLYSDQVTDSSTDSVKMVRQIAMGSPTIEKGTFEAKIAPEFKAYLRYCKKNGLVHVYNSYQNMQPKFVLKGDESVRCKAIKNLEADFPGTFYFVSFNEDGPFVKQTDEGICRQIVDSDNAATVISDIVDKLTKKKLNGYELQGKNLPGLPDGETTGSPVPTTGDFSTNPLTLESFEEDAEFLRNSTLDLGDVALSNPETYAVPITREGAIRKILVDAANEVLIELNSDEEKIDREGLISAVFDRFEILRYTQVTGPVVSVEEFKRKVISEMLEGDPEDTGNYVSSELQNRFGLKKWSEAAVDDIHKILFDSRALSPADRRIFIRIYQLLLAEKIKAVTGADVVNDTCKDGIDRAVARKLMKLTYRGILQDATKNKGFKGLVERIGFARAFIVRKRAISKHRLDYGTEVIRFMERKGMGPKLIELENRLFEKAKTTAQLDPLLSMYE